MKKKIISLLGLILVAGVFTYAAVIKSATEPATLENGDYYLYNVASGKWLGGGNSWGTQASLLKHANYFTLAKVEDGVYTLDSHISNGGDSHFLGNGGFVDAAAANWQIQKNGENYVLTLGDGKYIGWDGETTVLKTDIEDVASANAQWKIYSEAELIAQIKKTPYGTPVDATFLIKGADFSRNDQRVSATWEVSKDCTNKNLSGGNSTNNCAESYHSKFTISQTIENVPNGKYQLTAQGFYRQDGTDNDNLPYFFLNDQKSTVLLKTGAEDNMADASASFTAGNYAMETPIEVVVTDGKLNLGIANPVNTNLWVIFDNFELSYLGIDLSTLETALAKAREAAKVVIDANEKMNKDVYTALNAAYANSETVERTAEAYQAAIDNLNKAVTAAKASIAVYASIQKWYDDAKVNFTEEGYENFLKATAEIKTAYDNGTITDGVAENATLKEQYVAHLAKYYAPGADVTDAYIVNGNLLKGTEGWTCTPSNPGKADNGHIGALEFYAGWGSLDLTSYSMLQTIKLPAGQYRLNSNAFYRYSGAYSDDPTKSEAYMQCGNSRTLLPTLGSISGLSTYANSMDEALAAFEQGLYATYTDFKVLEDDTEIQVGYVGTHSVMKSWFISGPLRLEYMGAITVEAYINDIKAALATIPTAPMADTVKVALDKAVEGAQAIVGKYEADKTSVTAKDADAILNVLQDAINKANDSVNLYAPYVAKAADYRDKIANLNGAAKDKLSAVKNALENVEEALAEGKALAEIDPLMNVLVEAFMAAAKSQTGEGADLTMCIVNNSFEDDFNGWSQAGASLSLAIQTNTSFPLKDGMKYAEYWQPNGTLKAEQTITGLQSGIYEISVAALARDLSHANLYVNDVKVPIEIADKTDKYTATITLDAGTPMTIGVEAEGTGVGSSWFACDNFTLTYVGGGIPTCWDFTTITASEADGTGNLKNNIVADDGTAWSNHQNNAAITDAELTVSEGVPYALTKGLKFTAGGSGWIHIRNYPEANFGKQLYSNNKDLMMTVPVKAGQYVIFTALSAKGAITLKAIEGIDTTAIALCGHDKYVYRSKAGDVKFNLAKQMTIKKIEVVDAMPEGLWSFATITASETDGTGNLKNNIVEDGGAGWSNHQNNKAITDEELTISEGVPYAVTKGLKFTAGGSGWIHIRNYPEANGGKQFFSNNKDLKVRVPAKAGQYVIFDAFSASGTTQIVMGEDTVNVYPGGYTGHMIQAKEDNPVFNVKKQVTIKNIYVVDAVPYQLAANLKASVASAIVKVGDKPSITWSSDNVATPLFATDNAEVATVDSKGNITAVSAGEATITVSQPANAYFNEATVTIKVTVENAGPTELAAAITEAIAGKVYGDTATVTLDGKVAYTFEKPVDVGLVNLVINGNGAVVTLSDSVQIAGQQLIEINNVNFDCAANTKLAPIALSANPDSILRGDKFQTEGTSLRSGAYYNTSYIVLNGCNFSEVKTSLVSANKIGWNLYGLTIKNTIAQFDVASGIDSYINWYGNSKNEGSIKEIVIEGSTLYNIVEDNSNYFLRYANSSNSQPQKAWAAPQFDGKSSWTMTNNTIVNLPSNKNFANNYPNKNPICEFTWKGNIFYNTTLLQKVIQGNVANFTAADNSIIGITKTVDATDASKFATIDSLLIIGEKPFVVPTAALDLTKEIDLKANFQPYGLSYAGQMGFGDPRWKAEVYDAGLALDVDTVEYLGVRAKRANSWKFQGVGETFEIKVTTGNKAMPVVYASSNEAVVTVTPEGLATAVAPGSAIITMTQEPTAEFKAATLEMNVQVLPKAEYKKMYADADMDYMGINLSDVLAPVVVGGKTFYQIADSVASFVGYFDPTAPAQVQTSNRKMFIDYATDEPIEGGAAVASTDGTVTVAPIAGALNTHTNPNMPKQMYFLVSNTKAVKFYYTGSSSSGSTVTLWVINAAGDTIATVEGGAAAGKGTTSNVLTYTMPDKGNYKLAVWGTSGDMEVYYAKFFCETKPEPITEPRKWNFSNIKNDYADEYAAIWAAADYWTDGGARATSVVAYDGEELTIDGTTKIGFTEGLFWTAAAGKLLIGDGSSKNYKCIQTQKGVKFYIPQVAAGDTIKFVGCAPSNPGTFTFENAAPATIEVGKGSSYTEYYVVMTADGEFVYNAPQDFRLQSIAVIPATGTPTGINDVSTKNAKFFGEGIYDLNGRKVLNPVKGNIYIVNGKKYIAR